MKLGALDEGGLLGSLVVLEDLCEVLDVVLSQLECLKLGDLAVLEAGQDLPEPSVGRVDLVRSLPLPSICRQAPLLEDMEGRNPGEARWRGGGAGGGGRVV